MKKRRIKWYWILISLIAAVLLLTSIYNKYLDSQINRPQPPTGGFSLSTG